ncbi:MAG: transcription-repair coupling factor [Planctomycetaceae bacterium]
MKAPPWSDLVPLEAPRAGRRASFGGLYGGSLALLLSRLVPPDRPALVLHEPDREGDDVAGDLQLFGVEGSRLRIYPDAEDDERGLERLAILARMPLAPVVIASSDAARQPVPSRAALLEGAVRLRPGGNAPGPAALAGRLAEEGWRRVTLVTAPGEFSVRGDIFDLFPAGFDAPARLEYFGDELERIRSFDATTQRGAQALATLEVPLAARLGGNATLADHLGAGDPLFRLDPLLPPDAWPGGDLFGAGRGERLFRVRQIEPLAAGPESLKERIREACLHARHSYFACRNDAEEARVLHLLDGSPPPSLRFLRGRLSRSFEMPDHDLALLGYDDLLQHLTRRRPAPRRAPGRAIDDFLDLEPGDHVVHLAHGIGLFRGLERIVKQGASVEHALVEFQDGVRVYVPSSKIDLIQKYVGASGGKVRLGKVGGGAWARSKQRVKEAVKDLAVRLLELEAVRRQRPGIAFPPDDAMQHEFEASFPYEETPDQITTLQAIKADMEVARPMDRLLCGDVGYGKTELAMRAAFKAVLGARQVAVLVPTTVLAAQHLSTFRERMAGYPVRIEMLSRFRTDGEATAILEAAAAGELDILIGTHRLLGPEVRFRDLGLLVIDEEQRFGVEHKERLKALRATVDILTLTATPIPRTLNMSLLGLRDISNLTTPPEGRMPVQTEVREYDEGLVQQWIERELHRGGQVFLVHNRIESIHRLERLVAERVPQARRAVVHGRMNKHELEDSMLRFVAGEVDVLIATTIIESGLDIPNANTLIVDRAEWIGLADLHQLRGRVGRGRHKAFALFLLPPGRNAVGEVAEKRLRAIEEHSELGAGFRIALKDLEIRGAGNVLGAEQSGHIAEVGYELFCRLLEDAVKELRRERVVEATDTFVDLDVEAYLPLEYAGDPALKLGLTRRIAGASSRGDLAALEAELVDRCGEPPPPARALLDVARLRIVGQEHGIARFSLEKGGVLQMALREPARALPFLRKHLGASLRLPQEGLAVVAEPVLPPTATRALEVCLARLEG